MREDDPIIKNPTTYEERYFNDYYKEFYPEFVSDFNKNRPNVNIDKSGIGGRSFYNPVNKSINVDSYFDEDGSFVAELAHHKQGDGRSIKSAAKYA